MVSRFHTLYPLPLEFWRKRPEMELDMDDILAASEQSPERVDEITKQVEMLSTRFPPLANQNADPFNPMQIQAMGQE